jgi:hypothetical protein
MEIKEYFKKLFKYNIKNETCGNKNSRLAGGNNNVGNVL